MRCNLKTRFILELIGAMILGPLIGLMVGFGIAMVIHETNKYINHLTQSPISSVEVKAKIKQLGSEYTYWSENGKYYYIGPTKKKLRIYFTEQERILDEQKKKL